MTNLQQFRNIYETFLEPACVFCNSQYRCQSVKIKMFLFC